MKSFVAVLASLAVAAAAPTYVQQPYAIEETVVAGHPVAQTYVQHGIVGKQTVQVGRQAVQVGHEYGVAGQQVLAQPAYQYVAGEPKSYSQTVPIAPPQLPVAAAPNAYNIPAPLTNQGPAPADTVTQTLIDAPVRTHTKITPQYTQVVPELRVNKVPVEYRVNVPVPVHRDVVVEKKVARPYAVEVPQAVPVAAPYKVHDVHTVVQTPVVQEHTYSVHQPQVAVAHSY
ncbi:hypothetical protein TCAL_06451 [Tigriopus californicus]|uniref:DUF4794 domain-containing protein n=1 Tax=Tigriopus californicus TaxID=6832 RepID=A0A553PLP5_TIGCA|nr:uncharacterized protein LOC131890713 [Tigriopus californicus]TRY78599.1 hypothetical protein TCAL_06451 [Tigriopus californicus]|eukprot:TCALIF_06451-PA protein Name:"Protein of unknown function" AED:0.00 eAED:0.00 QI:231/1/1/1/1/1/2/205/228